MTTARKSIAVTGSSGYIGSTLLRHLEEYGAFETIVAIDNRPLPFPVHNLWVYRQDASEPIQDILTDKNVSTLVHLASISRQGRNQREINEIRDANLKMLQAVLQSCAAARVQHVIYLSSQEVYGARPDNPIPLTVRSPLQATPDSPVGYDKFLAEASIQDFSGHHGDIKFTILRACRVVGPTAPDQVTQAFSHRWTVAVMNHNPPLQFLYQEDLARVLHLFIEREIPGVFNVAGEGVVLYREMAEIIGSKLIRLPAFLAYPLVQLARNAHLPRHYSVEGLNLVRYPMVMSTGTLRQATGYKFWHTSTEALTSFAKPNLL